MAKNTSVSIYKEELQKMEKDIRDEKLFEIKKDISQLSEDDFKEKYKFSKSSGRSIINDDIENDDEDNGDFLKEITYQKPVGGYDKFTICFGKEAHSRLKKALDYLSEETGLEKRYLLTYLFNKMCDEYLDFIDFDAVSDDETA